jgi:phosphoribosylamine-glycine ligase
MNIMSLFEGSWPEVMGSIVAGTLTAEDVPLRAEASAVLYLVSPDYALRAGGPYDFTLDRQAIEDAGGYVFFSSAVGLGGDTYRTVGTSRAVALASTAPTLERARMDVARWAEGVPVLQWRRDVGDAAYLEGLSRLVAAGAGAGA